ncbi:hypothetical protein ACIP27_25640 [Streptomyces hydrogenans]|uniref:hypothetical protein n=1 Tax=Streptomyces hydrogenans TaxID=1873719 RepID=UPI003800F5E2
MTTVQAWTQTANVRNLTVADFHTYYVLAGATPVLVHNCGEQLEFAHGTTASHADDIAENGLRSRISTERDRLIFAGQAWSSSA